MLDVLFIFTMIVFFVVAMLYVYGCNWFIKDDKSDAMEKRGDHVETMGERAESGSVA